MPRDAVPTLRRLHRIELAAAQLDLAHTLRAEAQAAALLDAMEQRVRAEAGILQARPPEQPSVDAHAAWLAASAQAWRDARCNAQAALIRVDAAKLALGQTHADTRLLDALATRIAEQQRIADVRREQSEMETAISGRRLERVTGIEPA